MTDTEAPLFPACEDVSDWSERKVCADRRMMRYLNGHLTYPQGARDVGEEGLAVISFPVDEAGRVGEPKIDRTPHPELGEEALRVVSLMLAEHPVWIPARSGGEAVSRVFQLPIRFALHEPDKKHDPDRG